MFNIIPWGKTERSTALDQRADHPFDSLFHRFFERWASPFALDQWQAGLGLEMDESEKEYVVRIDAPGFEAGDFDLHVTGNMLTVKAERKEEAGKKSKKNGQAASYRRVFRSVSLPHGADESNVAAQYKNGVLEIRVGKEAEVQGRRIEVKGV